MSTETPKGPDDGARPDDSGMYTQEVQHSQVAARVPERVARGVFTTGALVAHGQHEFLIDFIQRLTHPQQIVARVVLPFSLMPGFISALQENLGKFQARHGAPAAPPPIPPGTPKPPSVQEIYDQLKLHDDMLSGFYANFVMITHSHAEFCFDFITNFYPKSAVSTRVFMAAPQVPALLANLQSSFQQYQQRQQQPPQN